MSAERKATYSPEEFARRGNELYERDVASRIPVAEKGKIVAIDIDSGAFVVAEDTMRASEELLEQYPDAQIWFVRIGHQAVHRFGPRLTKEPA